MQFVRAGQANYITADLTDGTDPITTGVVTHYLKALSGDNEGKWWSAAAAAWSATAVSAGTGTHDGRGHWYVSVASEAWTSGVRYQTYAVHADDEQINYRDEILCLTSGGVWPTAETDWPVSVAECKAHLRIDADDTDEDALIAGYIGAATEWAEAYTQRKFLTATIVEVFDSFPSVIRPKWSPLIAVTSIEYVDSAGTTQTMSSSLYDVDTVTRPGRIQPAYSCTWPACRDQLNAITLTYTAGYGANGDDVPQQYRSAILRIAADLYEHREDISVLTTQQVPFGAWQLLGMGRLLTF